METRITTKYQTTIPKDIRKILKVKPGDEVDWSVAKAIIIVDKQNKMKHPTEFLTSQGIKLNIDAVKLIREIREEA